MSEDGRQRYELIQFLGEGQFAIVYKARDTKKNTIVAVEEMKEGTRVEVSDGVIRTAVSEINFLKELSHPNIIGLQGVFVHKSSVHLVFDFMETDLETVIKDSKIVLTAPHIKCYMLQTLKGLEYLHAHRILHKDLKPNKLLINEKGEVKIGDFGLAKFCGSPSRPYSNKVVTRWYKCPELILGSKKYSTGVDIWAVGCILGELLTRLPLFPGDSDLDQLYKIFMKTGTPTQSDWLNIASLPSYIKFNEMPKIPFKELFITAGDDLLDLMEHLLALDPLKRCTASEALKMPYFSNMPYPSEGHQLPRPASNKITHTDLETRRAAMKGKQLADSGSKDAMPQQQAVPNSETSATQSCETTGRQ